MLVVAKLVAFLDPRDGGRGKGLDATMEVGIILESLLVSHLAHSDHRLELHLDTNAPPGARTDSIVGHAVVGPSVGFGDISQTKSVASVDGNASVDWNQRVLVAAPTNRRLRVATCVTVHLKIRTDRGDDAPGAVVAYGGRNSDKYVRFGRLRHRGALGDLALINSGIVFINLMDLQHVLRLARIEAGMKPVTWNVETRSSGYGCDAIRQRVALDPRPADGVACRVGQVASELKIVADIDNLILADECDCWVCKS